MRFPLLGSLLYVCGWIVLSSCASIDRDHVMVISIPDQQMVVLRQGVPIARYPVSTSKFGLSDAPGSYGTPLGSLRVKRKIGAGEPTGTVFKSRKPTGEVLAPNAPGRDPIVTRILWLDGEEGRNRNAFGRYIYIHGTPEERNIGEPASYGCIRMRSGDIVALFDTVGRGARVDIANAPIARLVPVNQFATQ